MMNKTQAGVENNGIWLSDVLSAKEMYAFLPLLPEAIMWSLSTVDSDAPFHVCDIGAGNLKKTISVAVAVALGRSGQVVLSGIDIQDSAVDAMKETITRMDTPQNLVVEPIKADITKGLDDILSSESQHLVILHSVTPWLQTANALYSSLRSLRRVMMRGAAIHIESPTQWNRAARPFPKMTESDLFVKVGEEAERRRSQMVTIYGQTYGRPLLFCPSEAMGYALGNTGFTLMDSMSVRNHFFPNGYGKERYCQHYENVRYFAVAE